MPPGSPARMAPALSPFPASLHTPSSVSQPVLFSEGPIVSLPPPSYPCPYVARTSRGPRAACPGLTLSPGVPPAGHLSSSPPLTPVLICFSAVFGILALGIIGANLLRVPPCRPCSQASLVPSGPRSAALRAHLLRRRGPVLPVGSTVSMLDGTGAPRGRSGHAHVPSAGQGPGTGQRLVKSWTGSGRGSRTEEEGEGRIHQGSWHSLGTSCTEDPLLLLPRSHTPAASPVRAPTEPADGA